MSIISQMSRASRQATTRNQKHSLSASPAAEIRDTFAKLFGEPLSVQTPMNANLTATQKVLRMK